MLFKDIYSWWALAIMMSLQSANHTRSTTLLNVRCLRVEIWMKTLIRDATFDATGVSKHPRATGAATAGVPQETSTSV